jgi:hypothetical protein
VVLKWVGARFLKHVRGGGDCMFWLVAALLRRLAEVLCAASFCRGMYYWLQQTWRAFFVCLDFLVIL